MSQFEVAEPILNAPYDEPKAHWWITHNEPPDKREGRRPAMYYYIAPGRDQTERGGWYIELKQVNNIRKSLKDWLESGDWRREATATTCALIEHWTDPDRQHRLFFAQHEAALTVIFLTEANHRHTQGIQIPRDEPSDDEKRAGYAGFLRLACKMATGAGKTTVMGMLAAWSILNKVQSRQDKRFSDVVLAVCPNVTIRDRLRELNPKLGEASLYRTRDLVPAHMMPLLARGTVIVTNWHVLAPRTPQTAGDGGKVVRAGVRQTTTETIRVGDKNDTKRGTRWLTRETLLNQIAAGTVEVVEGDPNIDTSLKIRGWRYVESDRRVVNRILRSAGQKGNILVFNDEAHHAYRVKVERPADWEEMDESERDEWLSDKTEATVWIDGLDRIQKVRGINQCIDLSATPYFLNRVGQEANRPFPWVVSDFGLVDAIESGLVKIPQLAVRDPTGASIPGYFNIWKWILEPGRLTAQERGGKREAPKPEAILKWAHHPLVMLSMSWEEKLRDWAESGEDLRPPVFILVCKDTRLANVFYRWLGEGVTPVGIPPSKLDAFRNTSDRTNTIVVHSRASEDSESGEAKGDENRWMRFTLDTVGKRDWPRDALGSPILPEGFAELAEKLKRENHPPGRDVRCIVSVGMLTEGWDCNTVTHIIGLRPFDSQLLCEQVVGRGLRRTSYEPGPDGRLPEEVAKVFGVPFQIVPFKANPGGPPPPATVRKRVHALPERQDLEIQFPRVEGYIQTVRHRVTVDWDAIAPMTIDGTEIPNETEVIGAHATETGTMSLTAPGRVERLTLDAFRKGRRLQELEFDLATHLTRLYLASPSCAVPANALFGQVLRIVQRYVQDKVHVLDASSDRIDAFVNPYHERLTRRLFDALHGDEAAGDAPELPLLETSRTRGSTKDVDFWTSRDVSAVLHSHINVVVADTMKWEQTAAYYLDTSPFVQAFAKNAKLGLAIRYMAKDGPRDYEPDFLVRLVGQPERYVLIETKGFDPEQENKRAGAERWCRAVSAHGGFGDWQYALVGDPKSIPAFLQSCMETPQARASARSLVSG